MQMVTLLLKAFNHFGTSATTTQAVLPKPLFIESVRDISTSPNINKTIAPFGFLCNDNSSLEL